MIAFALTAAARADVPAEIDAVLRDPYLAKVRVGIQIVRLAGDGTATTVYERDAARPMTPASNLKLVTTAAALETLGPGFVFRTRLVRKGDTLALVGDGDPSLGDAEALGPTGWKSTTLFEKWAEALLARGIKSADKLVYDDGVFDEQTVHPAWPGDQLDKRYVAGVSGLNFNANCVDFYLRPQGAGRPVDYTMDPATAYPPVTNSCVGGGRNSVWLSRTPDSPAVELRGQTDEANVKPISFTVPRPAEYTANVVADVLRKAGVAVGGTVARDATVRARLDAWETLAVYETPIAQVIGRANKDSINLYAEALCKRVGADVSRQPGGWPNGTAAVGAFLASIGVDRQQFVLDDGCGLSRKNAVSPAALVAVLRHEFRAPHRDAYLASLAVAGTDGTFKDRFGAQRDRVIGKSGFINGVSTLSGFLKARDGSTYAFSILFNGIAPGTNKRAHQVQEKIVQTLD